MPQPRVIETKVWPEDGSAPTPYPYSKWNVIRWFGNVEGMPDWYEPAWPYWRRYFIWNFIRNPMFNFFRYIVGIEDRRILVRGPAPVFATTWTDIDPTASGWKWSVIRTTGWMGAAGCLSLPFISYESPTPGWVFYIGWLPSGGRLGIKLARKS